MQIAIPKETHPGEKRIAMTPDNVGKLIAIGAQVTIETGMGLGSCFFDEEYERAGAQIIGDRQELLRPADMVLRLRKPPIAEIAWLKKGCVHIGFLTPFSEPDLVEEFHKHEISAISMEMVPRITRAQKIDALSSQASLAGYVAVIVAAERINRVLPMMTTAAGTIAPARVFIIGAGVAGLQAIATAKRLGARVEAYDTRPAVEEQVQSVGAKFVKIDLGQTGETKQGYAKALTAEQLDQQRQVMAKHCALSDIVITTAQLFGRPAPLIITKKILETMKPGSVVVDLAVESGGNVEVSEIDQEIAFNGVKVVGLSNLPGRVAVNASQMYSTNLYNLVQEFWNKDQRHFEIDISDDIMRGCLITHGKEIMHHCLHEKPEQRAERLDSHPCRFCDRCH